MFISLFRNRKHSLPGLLIALGIAVSLAVSVANPAHAEHEDFVGHEPPVCDILRFDGPINGKIAGNTSSGTSELQGTFNQFGCRITGELEISSRSFAGSGPFYGIVDGNVLRFTVTSETSDSPRDLNFSGLINGNNISGQYSIPHTRVVGEWVLQIPNEGVVSKLVNLKDSASSIQMVEIIRELQSRLSGLRLERAELAAELEHQVNTESHEIIQRWEQAIEDLKSEVEHEIKLETSRIDMEKRQVTLRLGRNTVVGELSRELDIIVAEKWAVFDKEAAMKQMYMNDELDELEYARTSKIERISRLIESTESDLQQKLKQSGLTLAQINSQPQDQELQVTHIDLGKQDGVVLNVNDDNPEKPKNDQPESAVVSNSPSGPAGESEPAQNRGFFLNSETGALGNLGDSLDPTTLAILGILITLSATAVQLVKGN